jgi:N-hydroxyarylamine O-acetyltransferase
MELQRYFEHIGYRGGMEPTLETLTALHVGHTFNIPFENLSPFYGETVTLDPDDLFEKFVTQRRGGYCFEMNGFFSAVLKQLGFKVLDLLARGAFMGEFIAKLHQVLAVEIDGNMYLADVGFGNDGIASPLHITENDEQAQFGITYRLTTVPRYGWVLERRVDDSFTQLFAFTLDKCLPMEFDIANHYTATHPKSFFRAMRFCTRPTETGRVTLTDTNYKIIKNGVTIERKLENEAEFQRLLMEIFGLDLEKIKTR